VVELEDRVVAKSLSNVSAGARLTARHGDQAGGLDSTLGEDGFAPDGVVDAHSLVSGIICVQRELARRAVEGGNHAGLLDEEAAVHGAVLAGDHDVRGDHDLRADVEGEGAIAMTRRNEKDLVLAKLGLIASVGNRPVLERAVAVAGADVAVPVGVLDTLIASLGVGADSAERWAGLAGGSVVKLEVAALPVLREAEGGAQRVLDITLNLGRLNIERLGTKE